MKKTVTALALVAAASTCMATTTITPANGTTTGTILQVIDNAGNPIGGNVLIGTFTDTTGIGDFSTAEADVLTNFVQLGSVPMSAAVLGTFGIAPPQSITPDLPNVGEAAGDFIGRSIFFVATDGSSNIVWDTGVPFAPEDAALDVGAPVTFNVATGGTLLRGTLVPGGNTNLPGALGGQNGGTAVTFLIPEPSTSLLAGLAGLGLLIRRKR